ncbi:hypothetical protein Cni_G03659 [Canna indica]|uniref:E3 ubiquitin-protein ligase RMA n=1 Tax=Canna indica TaxID=4628 RepID=A0AAQ3JRN4_9LILI|nr:hypothetical protein Cni_G03659 [Canna indica]
MADEQSGNSSRSNSNRMDLNLYLSLPSLPRSQNRDIGSDLTLNSVRLPWSPFAEAVHVPEAPYSPSNALSAPDILPTDPLHGIDNNIPGSDYNPYSSHEPNNASFAPESLDDPYTLPSTVQGSEPLIRERIPNLLPPVQFDRRPWARGVDVHIGYPPPPNPSSRIGHLQIETSSYCTYSQIRVSDLTAQGDALSVQQELRQHPEYRFQRLIELTNRLYSGPHSSTSPERLMRNIVQSQRALEASKKGAEGKEVEDLYKKNEDNAAANFECNICYELAKDPVVTPCGHLFCWACLYQWLHAHSVNSECPVCKGQVLEVNVTPIYGRGGDETKDHKERGEDEKSGLEIPPRPHANRIESFRQQLRERLEEGIANSWRNNMNGGMPNGPRTEGHRPSRRQGRLGSAHGLVRRRVRRIQGEEGSGSNSAGVGLHRDDTSTHPLIPTVVFHDGIVPPHRAGSPTSSPTLEPLDQHRHSVGPMMVIDQASASSTVAVVHVDTVTANPSAGSSAAGSSNTGRRRARNSALASPGVAGVRYTRNRRLN